MTVKPHCPNCRQLIEKSKERTMPDGVVEYRCPSCMYQIPLLVPQVSSAPQCPHCDTRPTDIINLAGLAGDGPLNLVVCSSCGCLLGRYWGLMDFKER